MQKSFINYDMAGEFPVTKTNNHVLWFSVSEFVEDDIVER